MIEEEAEDKNTTEEGTTSKDTVDKQSFALEEYKSLRGEILDKMEKDFRILSLGVGGITVILGFVFEYEIYELFYILRF